VSRVALVKQIAGFTSDKHLLFEKPGLKHSPLSTPGTFCMDQGIRLTYFFFFVFHSYKDKLMNESFRYINGLFNVKSPFIKLFYGTITLDLEYISNTVSLP